MQPLTLTCTSNHRQAQATSPETMGTLRQPVHRPQASTCNHPHPLKFSGYTRRQAITPPKQTQATTRNHPTQRVTIRIVTSISLHHRNPKKSGALSVQQPQTPNSLAHVQCNNHLHALPCRRVEPVRRNVWRLHWDCKNIWY